MNNSILYEVHNGLYVNLTNKCPCACVFCLRNTTETVGRSDRLWLEKEPTVEEVEAEFKLRDLSKYEEIVFCGFGEPTERLDALKEIAAFLKANYDKPIRVNTNGLGDLVNGRKIANELKGLVDVVSISLNTPNEDRYMEEVRPKFGKGSFAAMLSFARDCAKVLPKVVLSTVDTTLTKEEEAKCAEIAKEMGAVYRIRPFE
ncbi:MAG: TIGR04100 family radical SAM protein [Clostridia bacterium]|nr:TIGR04100 family radical SAM protein [Clostridia bacterium]